MGRNKAKVEVEGDKPSLNFLLSVPVHVDEQPLTPDISSILRDLVLFCSRERRQIAASDSAGKDDNIAALNLFICLVAKYFGQGDLEDRDDE